MKKNILIIISLFTFIYSQCNSENWQDYVPNLDGCNLSNQDLSSNDFSYMNLDDADLSGSNLSSCNFTGASMVNANLANVVVWNTNFTDALMCGIDTSELDFGLGDPITELDCFDVCGGSGELDECGVCDGDGTACFGCMDPFATNYSELAIYDDGSCEYYEGEISGDPPSTIWTHYLHDTDSPFENDVPTEDYDEYNISFPHSNCVESFNGGVTCAGHYSSYGAYNMGGYCDSWYYTGYIYELDINGTMLWFKEFGRWDGNKDLKCDTHNYQKGLIKGSDGYYLVGRNSGDYDKAYILKLDTNGNLVWLEFKDLDNSNNNDNVIYNGMEASNGNLVFVGKSFLSPYSQEAIVWIMDSDGNDINSFTYHLAQSEGYNNEPEYLFDVIETSDGNYVAVGTGYVIGEDAYYPLIIKFNDDGIIYAKHLIENPLRNVEQNLSVLELDNGNLLLTGQSNSYYALIIQVTSEGDFISFGMDHLSFELSTGASRFIDAIHTIDNKLLLFGWAGNGFEVYDFLTVKMDQQMNIEWVAYDGDVFDRYDYGHGIVQLSDNTVVSNGWGINGIQSSACPIVIRKHFQDGCIDENGCNYNPYASNDNGSCYFEDACDVCDGNGYDFCDNDDDGVNNLDQWGYGPYNISAEDIPEDQGGRVYLSFHKSFYDTDELQGNRSEMYSIQREDNGEWINVQSIGAYGEDTYSVEVTTLADDVSTNFRVIANMDEGNFLSYEQAEGISEDNIAPAVPTILTGAFNDGEIALEWSPPEDEDFGYYQLYRDGEPYAQTIETSYTDIEVPSVPLLSYTITALDHSGNESAQSESYEVQAHVMGDLNDDYLLNVLDIVIMVEYILDINSFDTTYADMNSDGEVDILDVVILLNIILSENSGEDN